MNLWTSVFLSFLFCLSAEAKCDLKTNIYSLSGPVTVALKEMGLLKNPRLKGVSVFHPISEKEFSGKFFPGGVFLSPSVLAEFKDGVVFYDESRDLAKILKGHEIKTRGLSPYQVVELVIQKLTPVISGCDQELIGLKKISQELEKKILAKLPHLLSINFYIGVFHQGRPPEMIMSHDGVVKWLKEQNKIVTYPSELAYVNWSAKILQKMAPSTLQVALKDSGKEMTEQFVQTSENISFIYPGILIPGISQQRGFLSFFEKVHY